MRHIQTYSRLAVDIHRLSDGGVAAKERRPRRKDHWKHRRFLMLWSAT